MSFALSVVPVVDLEVGSRVFCVADATTFRQWNDLCDQTDGSSANCPEVTAITTCDVDSPAGDLGFSGTSPDGATSGALVVTTSGQAPASSGATTLTLKCPDDGVTYWSPTPLRIVLDRSGLVTVATDA
jgi:hypothetical protein